MKSCPWCNSTKVKFDCRASRGHLPNRTRYTASIRCGSCHARGPTVSIEIMNGDHSEQNFLRSKAEELWNNQCKS
jgi:hypothetical protein